MRIYSNKIFSVAEENKKMPSGMHSKVYSVLHHGGAVILPIEGDMIIIERHYRPVVHKWLYELPAGMIERGETPEQCAKREIAEELGITADRLVPLFRSYPTPGYSTEVHYFFAAYNIRKLKRFTGTDEMLTAKRVSIKSAMHMIRDGKIVDGKSIQALLYYKTFTED